MAAIFVENLQEHVHQAFQLAIQHPLEPGQQHALPGQLLGLHEHERRVSIPLCAKAARQVERVVNHKGDLGKLRSVELILVVASVRPTVEAARRQTFDVAAELAQQRFPERVLFDFR